MGLYDSESGETFASTILQKLFKVVILRTSFSPKLTKSSRQEAAVKPLSRRSFSKLIHGTY